MKLNITQVYPDLLSLYGDSGNIAALKYRALWRNIDVEIKVCSLEDEINLENTDVLYLGGGTDKAIKTVAERLISYKDKIKAFVENDGCVLAVCSGYQLLGNHFMIEDEKIQGLGILDITSEYSRKRKIGNVILKSDLFSKEIVGFENRNGITNIGNLQPLGAVLKGNEEKEGVVYKNVIGTYLHGPLLPKNPAVADYIIEKALTKKYDDFRLKPLDDTVELAANDYICKQFI